MTDEERIAALNARLDKLLADTRDLERVAEGLRRKRESLLLAKKKEDLALAATVARITGKPMPTAKKSEQFRLKVLAENRGTFIDPEAPKYHAFAHQASRRKHRVIVRAVVVGGSGQGYARFGVKARTIEVEKVRDAETFAVVLHEIAHIVKVCEPSHVRVPDGGHSRCIRCELTAWRWATDTIVGAGGFRFTREMQGAMKRGLTSYRPLATPTEQREIDFMLGEVFFKTLIAQRRC